MLSLVPSWAVYNELFWNSVNRRNRWFIKLRYAAVLMLIALIIGTEFIFKLHLSSIQLNAVVSITLLIFIYNIFIKYLSRKIKPVEVGFNNLHLSLLQIILDLISLTLLVYFLGTIENPMYMFYIFHMIIGSLILPGSVIYTISISIVIIFSCIILLEYYGILFHHSIYGLLSSPIYKDTEFIFLLIFVFSLMMFMSVVLANRIANELYRREQDLVETLTKLNEAEKTKQKYIMGVVHELKTPIAAIQSYLDLILKNYIGPVEKEISERLNRAKVRAEESLQMINEVLQISRLRMPENITMEEIDVITLLKDVICRHIPKAELRSIRLELKDNRNSNRFTAGDKSQLDMALSNLIGNSIKYNTNNGIVEITISDNDNYLQIEICDDGLGIPEKELDKVFLDFYRASNIKHNGFEGTGMGLSIVKQIINNHGGKITVVSPSRLNKLNRPGTSFIITLQYKS